MEFLTQRRKKISVNSEQETFITPCFSGSSNAIGQVLTIAISLRRFLSINEGEGRTTKRQSSSSSAGSRRSTISDSMASPDRPGASLSLSLIHICVSLPTVHSCVISRRHFWLDCCPLRYTSRDSVCSLPSLPSPSIPGSHSSKPRCHLDPIP